MSLPGTGDDVLLESAPSPGRVRETRGGTDGHAHPANDSKNTQHPATPGARAFIY